MTILLLSSGVILPNRIVFLSALFLAAMIVLVARMGIADLYSLRPNGPMDERPAASIPNFGDASKSVDIALRLDPLNPNDRLERARIDYRMAAGSGKDKHALFDDALYQARRSIRLRPTSPYSWSTLLRIKADMGEVDGEFMTALDSAVMLGPWEEETQRMVAEAGLDVWPKLSMHGKMAVLEDIKRGMRRQAPEMIRIALDEKCRIRGHDCR
jgi:hypothetical protein